jgi:hypothetical protein
MAGQSTSSEGREDAQADEMIYWQELAAFANLESILPSVQGKVDAVLQNIHKREASEHSPRIKLGLNRNQ